MNKVLGSISFSSFKGYFSKLLGVITCFIEMLEDIETADLDSGLSNCFQQLAT